jgi:hypothetical protein
MDKIKEGDLLLLDRGYPCFWLLFMLKARGIEFCVRLKDNWWMKVKEFVASSEKERTVTFPLPRKDRSRLKDYPYMQDATVPCRLLRVELEDGNIEVLCTYLTDTEKYLYEVFKALYHYRWNEEEATNCSKAGLNWRIFLERQPLR